MSWIDKLVRPDLLGLKTYEHASWEPGLVRLHANELPWRATGDETVYGLNQYPEPQPRALIERLAQIYQVPPERLLLSRGSDEAIDLLVRAFCRAGEDSVLICPPTFGMYQMAAKLQGAKLVTVPLRAQEGFSLDPHAVVQACDASLKLIFLCSPNKPTGNPLADGAILEIINAVGTRSVIVLDEAYLEFADRPSLAPLIARRPQLVILRTLSKAYGLAGARLGVLMADPQVVALLRKLIAPYAISQTTLETVMPLLSASHLRTLKQRLKEIRIQRTRVFEALEEHPEVLQVFPSEANFLLARFTDPADVLSRARHAKLLVRDVRAYPGLHVALRITIGTAMQNDALLEALR